MASKSQKSMPTRATAKSSPKSQRQAGKADNRSNLELLPSDRNEKSDISAKIAFLAYN